MDHSELRKDPWLGHWTLFTPARSFPPLLPGVTGEAGGAEALAAGNERFAPHGIYQAGANRADGSWQVRVVPNRVPMLRVEADGGLHGEDIYDRMEGLGAHEVIVEDPAGTRMESLSVAGLEAVLRAWRARIADLRRDSRLRSFFIARDTGRFAGARTARGVAHLVAMPIVPPVLREKVRVAEAFHAEKERSLFAEILEAERKVGKRIVYENAGFIAFCPYASRVPFEVALWPKQDAAHFEHCPDLELTQFAEVLRHVLRQINVALDNPACHVALTTAPVRPKGSEPAAEGVFRWHVEILPRINPVSAFETVTGCHTNCVLPEDAAAYLRGVAPTGVEPECDPLKVP
jgi:UDPglucose--hexose-1-phosphate uridylyltransferase